MKILTGRRWSFNATVECALVRGVMQTCFCKFQQFENSCFRAVDISFVL